MTEEDFWQLSPLEFDLLCKRKRLNDRQDEYNAALISCVIANVNRSKKGKSYKPEDFMTREKKEKKVADWKQMKRLCENMTIGMGGKINVGTR